MAQRACLLFDIDRTLMDSAGAGGAALRRAFALESGGGQALDGIAFHGRTDGWIVREVARSAGLSLERLRERYASDYPGLLREELAARKPWALPGVIELMQALQARDGVAFCIGSGNSRDAAFMKLARVGLDAYFDGGGFGARHDDRAEMLRDASAFVGWQPGERLVVIGDSEQRCRRRACRRRDRGRRRHREPERGAARWRRGPRDAARPGRSPAHAQGAARCRLAVLSTESGDSGR